MTEEQIGLWLKMLGRTPSQQIAAVTDLLSHANGDEMSRDDRTICLRALQQLGTTYVRQKICRNQYSPPRQGLDSDVRMTP